MTEEATVFTKNHLPLKLGMGLKEVVEMMNSFYELEVDLDKYKKTQVFLNLSGKLEFELINRESNEVEFTFINKNSVFFKENSKYIATDSNSFPNPLDLGNKINEFIFKPLLLIDADELYFLDNMTFNQKLDISGPDTEVSFKLRTLLNNYNYGGRWVNGTLGRLSTAGFELIYMGSSRDVPNSFMVDPSDKLAIIKIHHGETTGYICLRT